MTLTTTARLKLSNVGKSYAGRDVVKDVSLSVEPGQVTCLRNLVGEVALPGTGIATVIGGFKGLGQRPNNTACGGVPRYVFFPETNMLKTVVIPSCCEADLPSKF